MPLSYLFADGLCIHKPSPKMLAPTQMVPSAVPWQGEPSVRRSSFLHRRQSRRRRGGRLTHEIQPRSFQFTSDLADAAFAHAELPGGFTGTVAQGEELGDSAVAMWQAAEPSGKITTEGDDFRYGSRAGIGCEIGFFSIAMARMFPANAFLATLFNRVQM